MEIIAESFLVTSYMSQKNHALPGDNEIKKMSMLKRQVRMADDDESDHIVKNLQRVLRLNGQYKHYPYDEEFIKECHVMFVYRTNVPEGELDAKFSLGDVWNLFQGDYNASNFCRQMINYMKAWD